MAIQIQAMENGRGLNQPWTVLDEYRGYKLPKDGLRYFRDLKRENNHTLRLVTSKDPEFIKLPGKPCA
jgi:hypothetical protein